MCQDPRHPVGSLQFRAISVGNTLGETRSVDQQNFAHPGSAVRMDSVVVLRFGSRELHFAGGSSKVLSFFCSPTQNNMTQHCVGL